MSTVKYKFQSQDDLLFYILNAVGHDFIHDFNNYGRMGKILNYIMGLVQNVVSPQEVDLVSQAFSPSIQALAVEQERDIAENSDNPNSVRNTIMLPVGVETSRPEYDTQIDNQNIFGTEIMLANGVNTTTPNPQSPTDNPVDDSTQTLTIEELYVSQMEDNLISEPLQPINITDSQITSQSLIPAIVNENIRLYNIVAETIPIERVTRTTTKKINIMQRLKDFIQEGKFLIISKLRSAFITSFPGRSGGGVKRNKKQKGGNGIDIITRDDIIASIKDIIEEIKETTPENLQLISFFEYIMYSYLNLSIPGISPLEIFNNSLIEDSASIFIVGQCKNTDIREQAKLCLTALLSVSATSQDVIKEYTPSLDKAKGQLNLSKFMARGVAPPRRGIPTSLGRQQGGNKIIVGGAFNGTTYNLPENISIFQQFDSIIETFKQTNLYINYINCTLLQNLSNMIFVGQIYSEYENFITSASYIQGKNVIELIVGKQMLNVKRTIIENKKTASNKGGRNATKNIQEMVDTITDLIFVKTIDVYNDVKNRIQARSEDNGDGSSISGSAKTAVQRVSKLVASKILALTGASSSPTNLDSPTNLLDLNKQIEILNNIAKYDKGYISADDVLITHFIQTYGTSTGGNISSGNNTLTQLDNMFKSCNKTNCRVINNAVPQAMKEAISTIVVCPTSSVCDGMGSFGSCVNPAGKKEYANMNFSVTARDVENNFYYGQTNIKKDLTSVNINYGISYNNLQIYNFIDIKLDSQPIVLQANYVFKNLINRIIELWKTAPGSNIDDLWDHLYGTDYFLSILKLGTQKAVGDIFQEINSTLSNGGYSVEVQGIRTKNTYGLMGDRPSGVHVFKLLNNSDSGKNPKASGGFVGGNTTFMYFSQPSTGGGNKITRKRKNKITNKYYRRRSKQTKRKNKNNKTK